MLANIKLYYQVSKLFLTEILKHYLYFSLFQALKRQLRVLLNNCSQSNFNTIRGEFENLVSSVPENIIEYFGGQTMEKVSSFTLFEIERAVGKFSFLEKHTKYIKYYVQALTICFRKNIKKNAKNRTARF